MQYWASDYQEGCAPEILRALSESNFSHHPGYGTDDVCRHAADEIRHSCGQPDAEVWFLEGGTQTNITVLSALLKPWEGVLTASTGHINCHEAGGPEAAGVKSLVLPGHDGGKIDADQVEKAFLAWDGDASKDHIVQPGVVYISHPTEYGALYTKAELESLSEACHRHGMHLFLDGARLAYALAVPGSPTLEEIARYADVFYIGGTKCGALLGEAVVARRGLLPHFFTLIKQHGALLAKGWVLGTQFDELFKNGLYLRLGKNGVERADELRAGFRKKGYELFQENKTNQVFVVLPDPVLASLQEKGVIVTPWEKTDAGHTACRFATSWATKKEDVMSLMEEL